MTRADENDNSIDTADIPSFVSGGRLMTPTNSRNRIKDSVDLNSDCQDVHISDSHDTDDADHDNLSSFTEPTVTASVTAVDEGGSSIEDINISSEITKRFNFMVVGPTGSGKSTFCLRLLQRYFPDYNITDNYTKTSNDDESTDNHTTAKKSRSILQQKKSYGSTKNIEQRGRAEKYQGVNDNTRIIITVIDTPGFGEKVDPCNDQFESIVEYITYQQELYERKEVYRNPNNQEKDTRIHCCFYFLTSSRVTVMDQNFMCKLEDMVAIVPIIPKADMMETKELAEHLYQIQNVLFKQLNIKVFDFNEGDSVDASWLESYRPLHSSQEKQNQNETQTEVEKQPEEDPQHQLQQQEQQFTTLPRMHNVFAVISGNRKYLWGEVSESDTLYSDTQRLHKILFKDGSLGRLHDHTHSIHENWYRNKKIEEKIKKKEEEFMLSEHKKSARKCFFPFFY